MPGGLSKTFGSLVRKYRTEVGLSQEALAEEAQLHPTYISMIERGVKNPTLDTAARIAAGLSVPLSQLIQEAEKAAAKPGKGRDR